MKLFILRARLHVRKYFFSHRVVPYWNSLPQHVVNAPSVNSFKSRLDTYWHDMDVNSRWASWSINYQVQVQVQSHKKAHYVADNLEPAQRLYRRRTIPFLFVVCATEGISMKIRNAYLYQLKTLGAKIHGTAWRQVTLTDVSNPLAYIAVDIVTEFIKVDNSPLYMLQCVFYSVEKTWRDKYIGRVAITKPGIYDTRSCHNERRPLWSRQSGYRCLDLDRQCWYHGSVNPATSSTKRVLNH